MSLVNHDAAALQAWSEFLVSPGMSPMIVTALDSVADALQGVEFALIGGQAVFLHGYQRFSKDVDIGVIVPVKQVAARLQNKGFRQLRGARFVEPRTSVEVDVVKLPRCAIPSVKSPELRRVGSHDLPVLDLETLIALKVKVGRIQDEADVVALLKTGREPDRARLVGLLRGLGEGVEPFDRLADRARRELEQQAAHEREQAEEQPDDD